MEPIKQYLQLDVHDTTAAAIVAANPTEFTNPSQVPTYLYTSLQTLLLGPTPALGDSLARRIVAIRGTGASVAEGYIQVHTAIAEPYFQSECPFGDVAGAEFAISRIYFGIPKDPKMVDPTKIRNLEMRVRHLLDETLRALSGKYDMPVLGDNSYLSNGPFMKIKWLNFTSEITTSEVVSTYKVEYVRTVGKIPNLP